MARVIGCSSTGPKPSTSSWIASSIGWSNRDGPDRAPLPRESGPDARTPNRGRPGGGRLHQLGRPARLLRPGLRSGRTSGAPLVGEDGVDQLVAPGALDELGLAESCLEPHPEPLPEPGRRVVACVARAEDPVQAVRLEPQLEHGPARFRGETLPLVLGVEHEADVRLAVLATADPQAEVADQR